MLRVTIIGVALAAGVAACTSNDRNAATSDTSMGGLVPPETTMTAPDTASDTMGAMAPGVIDTSSAAGALDTMADRAGAAVDTLAGRAGEAVDEARAAAGAGAAAVGDAASEAAIRTQLASLSSDQVRQLQTALNSDGCDVGTPDGQMGRRTRDGVQCSLEKHDIGSTNVDSLYKVLNLNFQ